MTAPGRRASCPSDEGGPFEAVHANYWLSGLAGHVIKHELDLPLVCTFHTLDRVKAEAGPEEVEADMPHRRAEAEAEIIGCSDAVLASCSVEAEQIAALYGAEPCARPGRPAGRRPRLLRPRPPPQARRALGLPDVGAAAPLRRPHPAAEGCRRGRARPRRACAPIPSPAGWSSSAGRAARAASGPTTSCCRWPSELGVADRRPPGRPPAPRAAVDATTGRPTSASSRAARSPSGWWPSRRRPAGPRWSPRPSAGLTTLVERGRPASSSTSRTRTPSSAPCAGSSTTRCSPSASAPPRPCRARGYTWRGAAARLARHPRRAASRAGSSSADARGRR